LLRIAAKQAFSDLHFRLPKTSEIYGVTRTAGFVPWSNSIQLGIKLARLAMMLEGMLILVGFLAIGLPLFIFSIVAFARSNRFVAMDRRLEKVEGQVRRLLREARASTPREEIPEVQAVEATTPAPRVAPRPSLRQQIQKPSLAANTDAAEFESWVGQKGLGWAAVVLLIFATGFFLKYAFENQWIGEWGRVAIGAVAGLVLGIVGWREHRRERGLACQMFTAASASVLYLTTYAAYAYYQLIPQELAGFLLFGVVISTAGLALFYEAQAIALMAVIGGLLSPLLLHSEQDQYLSLFTYLAILNVGVLFVGWRRRWFGIAPTALVGTQGLFWLWYSSHYQIEKRPAALCFQIILFGLYLFHDVGIPILRRYLTDPEKLVGLVLNAFFLALAGYVMLVDDYRAWLGAVALGVAVVYGALSGLVRAGRSEDGQLVQGLAAIALAFIAVAIALEGQGGWIALGWAVEGTALYLLGSRARNGALRVMGTGLLAMGVSRFLLVNTPWDGRELFVPFFNSFAGVGLAIAACMLAVGWTARQLKSEAESLDEGVRWTAGLGGLLFVLLVLSFEVAQAVSHSSWADRDFAMDRAASTSLSILWAVYAALVLALGFALTSRPMRLLALGLFGLTMGKVVLIDMAGLPGFYRVGAFFVLAVMMGGGAWTYQKWEARNRKRERAIVHEL
jgi:uncharacterized membrane protein